TGQRLDGQTFIGVKFDLPALKNVSFQGATLRNVSFRPGGIWSMKRAIQSMHFGGALMDKLTYAALKGIGADVSQVTVLWRREGCARHFHSGKRPAKVLQA